MKTTYIVTPDCSGTADSICASFFYVQELNNNNGEIRFSMSYGPYEGRTEAEEAADRLRSVDNFFETL